MAGSAWSNQAVIAALVEIIAGAPGAGLFVYSGTPAAGNLIVSIAAAAGTDSFGNHYVQDLGVYDNTFGGVAQLNGAQLTLFAGVIQEIILNPHHFTIFNSHGATIYDIDVANDAWFLYADTGSSTQGALILSAASAAGTDQFGNAFEAAFASYGAGMILQMLAGGLRFHHPVTDFATGPSLIATGSNGLGATLTLDSGNATGATDSQFILNDSKAVVGLGHRQVSLLTDQQILQTAGAAPATSALLEVDGTIAANLVEAIVSGAAETWHNLTPVNGWTGTMRYRLLPDGRVELDLALSSAAATAFQFSTMPAGYIPANTVEIAAGTNGNLAANNSPYVQVVGGTGAISMNGLHAFSTAGTWFAGGSFPLN